MLISSPATGPSCRSRGGSLVTEEAGDAPLQLRGRDSGAAGVPAGSAAAGRRPWARTDSSGARPSHRPASRPGKNFSNSTSPGNPSVPAPLLKSTQRQLNFCTESGGEGVLRFRVLHAQTQDAVVTADARAVPPSAPSPGPRPAKHRKRGPGVFRFPVVFRNCRFPFSFHRTTAKWADQKVTQC